MELAKEGSLQAASEMGHPHSVLDLLPSAQGACGVKSSDLGPGPRSQERSKGRRPLASRGGSFPGRHTARPPAVLFWRELSGPVRPGLPLSGLRARGRAADPAFIK